MKISTQFGPQQIDPSTLITLARDLPGFAGLTQFKLFHEEDKPTVFSLQSVEDAEVQFPVVDPATLNVHYELTLSDEELELLQLTDVNDLAVVVTLAREPGPLGGLHANFLGPILINTSSRLAIQKPLNKIESSVVIRAQ